MYQPFIACTNYNKEKRKTDVDKITKLEQKEKRKNVIQTNIRSVGGVADVELYGEAVSEEGVDVVSPPDDLTGVPVADRLAVSQEDVVTIQHDHALVTGDVLSGKRYVGPVFEI